MRILLNKTSSLGDIVHCYPIVAYLKEKFPQASVDWIIEKQCHELASRHPSVNKVHIVDTKKWRKKPFSKETRTEFQHFKNNLQREHYEVLFDLQGNMKSAMFTFLAHAENKIGFGRKSISEWPNLCFTHKRYDPPPGLNIRNAYLFLAQSFFHDFSFPKETGVQLQTTPSESAQVEDILKRIPQIGGKNIVICPGSNWENKKLPVQMLARLLKQFPGDSHFLIIWGNDYEKKNGDFLNHEFPGRSVLVPRLSLPSLQNLLSKTDLVISMDSLPLHLAGTTNTPTLSFFGPSLAEVYQPLGDAHQSIQGECPYGITFSKRCPKLRTCATGACLRTLNPKI